MKLEQLLCSSDVNLAQAIPDLDIEHVTLDSRKCRAKTLFVAAPGATPGSRHGAFFIEDAIGRGASAIISEQPLPQDIAQIIVKDARKVAAQCAETLAGHPSRSLSLFGVTGTNGKTSVTFFLASLLKALGHKSAVVGTIGIGDIDELHTSGFTTPEAEVLSPELAKLVRLGYSHVAMEVSSHALALSRCDGLTFSAAAFLNLSEDHLDFHHDMASYRAAKERLFLELLPQGAPCVLPLGNRLVEKMRAQGHPVLTFGTQVGADIAVLSAETLASGTRVSLLLSGMRSELTLPVFGAFNLDNVMCAAGLALAQGMPVDAIIQKLPLIRRPPARLDLVEAPQGGPLVFVDFAHTPDALQKVIETVRAFSKGALHVVFGCGGDRDRQKRPLMGAIVTSLADEAFITNDNPRHEDPEQIFRDICSGLNVNRKFKIIPDRAKAIHEAILTARTGDVVLIAGKGHETTQQIGDVYTPFSDSSVAKKALEVWQK